MENEKMKLIDAITRMSDKCLAHAKTCRRCLVPIMDAEGNPKYVGEACRGGAELLKAYIDLEKQYFAISARREPGKRRKRC